jgi:hypothetical protein
MATTAYSTLLRFVVPYVNRVPEAFVLETIAESARGFFDESEIWREDMVSFNTVVDQADYTIDPEETYNDVLIKRVEKLTLDDSEYPYDASLYRFSADNVLTFDPAPLLVQGVVLNVAYVPTMDATEISDTMMSQWGRHIAEGAVAKLKMDRGNAGKPNPWYDAEGAVLWDEKYWRGIHKARLELMTGRQSMDRLIARRIEWV